MARTSKDNWTTGDQMQFERTIHKELKSIREAIEKHIDEENKRDEILHAKVDKIQYTIDNVQVNGRKGINESFQDVYLKIGQLQAVDRKSLMNKPLREIIFSKSWLAKGLWILFAYVVLTTLLHAIGITLDLQDLVKLFVKA
jgi:hypothetical protein